MMKIVIIDGQGGKIGSLLVGRLKAVAGGHEVYAIGTNSIATSAMMKAGADAGATGENPVVVNCRDADVVIGPIGIVIADSLIGEITPAMVVAVGQSSAQKVLLPVNRCNTYIVGSRDMPVSDMIESAVKDVMTILKSNGN
jgi:nucleoside-diphosphate-sugar epimerase